MPSKLEQLQQQYRRQLLQEKEERMIKIHTESQQKALSKVARYNGIPTSNTFNPQPPVHHSPVKKGSPGVDRSRPLPPISKERYTGTRTSPVSAPTDNASKVTNISSRSKSVDLVDSRQSPPRGLQNDRNGYTNVSETSYESYSSTRYEETKYTSHVESKSVSKTKPTVNVVMDTKPIQQERKPDSETLAKLKQAELQRLRSKPRDETPPRQNGSTSDTVAKSSTISSTTMQKKVPAKTPTTTPVRSKPSFLNATAASSRKVAATPASVSRAPAQQQPRGKAAPAARPTAGRKPPGPGQEQCRVCGRNFNADRIEKHVSVCQKASQKKVKVFDATKMRVKGTEAESFVKKGVPKVEPKKKSSDWRKKHNEFIEAIRQAKLVQQHLANGGKVSDLPPPKPSDTSDYVQCPYCNRKFNEGVAERHIPKCKNILSNKKNPVPRKK